MDKVTSAMIRFGVSQFPDYVNAIHALTGVEVEVISHRLIQAYGLNLGSDPVYRQLSERMLSILGDNIEVRLKRKALNGFIVAYGACYIAPARFSDPTAVALDKLIPFNSYRSWAKVVIENIVKVTEEPLGTYSVKQLQVLEAIHKSDLYYEFADSAKVYQAGKDEAELLERLAYQHGLSVEWKNRFQPQAA